MSKAKTTKAQKHSTLELENYICDLLNLREEWADYEPISPDRLSAKDTAHLLRIPERMLS